MNELAAAVLRRLFMEAPGLFTEVSMEEFMACFEALPPENRWCNPEIPGRRNLLFAGHWIVPRPPQ